MSPFRFRPDDSVPIERRVHDAIVLTRVAIGVIGLVVVAGLVGGGLLIAKINDSRRENTYDSCLAANERHQRAIDKTLILAAPQLADAKTKAARARIVHLAGDLADAFAPRQSGRDLLVRKGESQVALRARQGVHDRETCERYARDRV